MKTACILWLTAMTAIAEPTASLHKVQDGGIQPKIVTDHKGTTHLVYYKGKADAGDLYYTRRESGGDWSPAVMVNSIKGSAVSIGTIRGAQFALGPDGSIHVVWNGSRKALPESLSKPPMWYAHADPQGANFTKQKTVSDDLPVDGGGAIAIDRKGAIHLYWHSIKGSDKETDRRIFQRTSQDGGKSFGPAKVISPADSGVCACCSMQALSDSNNQLYVLYRSAEPNGERNICLLFSKDESKSFERTTLDHWKLQSCPMSSMSMIETPESVLMAWEADQKIRVKGIPKSTIPGDLNITLGPSKAMKHPALARSTDGRILLVWTEGTGWNRGGSIGWQIFDSNLKPTTEISRQPKAISPWSFAGGYFDSKESAFHVIH